MEQGGAGRGKVYEALRRGDLITAVAVARGIRHPWYRCQSLAIAAMEVDDAKLRLALVNEALTTADQLGEPNRVVTVAAWPMEVLARHGPAERLHGEVRRLLTVAATEPHGLRRADAQSWLLHRIWSDIDARQQVLDALVATCEVAFGWRRDRLLTIRRRTPGQRVVAVGTRYQRRARRDVDAALARRRS